MCLPQQSVNQLMCLPHQPVNQSMCLSQQSVNQSMCLSQFSTISQSINRVARSALGKTGHPLPFLHPLPLSFPSLPLEVGPLNPARGSGRAL